MRMTTYRARAARLVVGLAMTAGLGAQQPPSGTVPVSSPAAWDLSSAFRLGPIFQDRNGDGVIDFVAARIEIGDASTSDVAAAADVAARLGFETSAMNLPLTAVSASADTVPIIVGAPGLANAGVSPTAVGAAGLGPGEGLVTATSVNGKRRVVVVGADAEGTRAAA